MARPRSPRNKPSQAGLSQNFGTASTSRFLNTLNPLSSGRPSYSGYIQADQSLREEEEDNRLSSDEQIDLEEVGGDIFRDQVKAKSPKGKPRHVAWGAAGGSESNILRPNIRQADKATGEDSSDDEVPQSFMIEAAGRKPAKGKGRETSARTPGTSPRQVPPPLLPTHTRDTGIPPTVSIPPRPSEVDEPTPRAPRATSGYSYSDTDAQQPKQKRGLDAHQRALWNWVNVYNLDEFLQEVYYYYEGKGIYSIALARGLNLLTVGFVIGFSTFLLGCLDYSRIRPEGHTRLSDIIVDRCVSRFSGFTFLFFLLFLSFYIWQIVSFVLGVVRLVDMYNFYTHLLGIPDADIQTIAWPEVVRRIGAIRQENPITAIPSSNGKSKMPSTAMAKLDAHDIASRILRQENYLIALFNKELLDFRVPVPAILKPFWDDRDEQGKGKMLSRALEWNLRFCLMEFLFDEHGRVRKVFLKSKNRAILIEGLKRRFIFMGILNAIFAPFIVLYLLMYSFFRYFEEYHKNPSSIGGRRYTPFAQWKFREFNELPHIFARRLDESYPAAGMYIGQFPNEKMSLIARFVAFVSGSFAAVLVLASVIDPDLFLSFEITPHRTVLFYITLTGTIVAVARGMVADDHGVFDPEELMMEVVGYTHYMPDEWKGALHSKKVHQEFGELFAMKIMIFVQELSSVVLTPFVLWLSLPACAPAIIDFFRDFSVHVDGMGYVCSFAEFNFQRHGNVKFGAPTRIEDQRMVSNEGKMEKSFLNFKAANPDWNPSDPSGSMYLSRMADFSAAHPRHSPSKRRPQQPSRRDPVSPTKGGTAVNLSGTLLADKASEYDRALKQSQYAATTRRRGVGTGSVVHGGTGSVVSPGGLMASTTMYQSALGGGAAMAQTAVLGDSQGSIILGPPASSEPIPDEDLLADGGVGSALGESYVDGARRSKTLINQGEDEDEGLQDGGVLGLLAQIYGGRGLHT